MLSLLLFFSRESLNSGCNYTYNDTLRCKQEAQDENFNSKKTRVSRGHPYNSLSGFRFTRHCLVLSLVMWPISKISAKFLWVPGQILLSCAIRTALTQVMRMYTFIPRFKGFQIIRFLNWYYKKNPVKRSQCTQIMNIHIHANVGEGRGGGGVIAPNSEKAT